MRSPKRLSLLLTLLFATVSLVACDATIAGDDEAGSGSGSGSGSDSGGDGEWEPCSADNLCPDGQFCFNGLCAIGCQSNGDCGDDQYCDTDSMLCQNQQVPTCAGDDECASSQLCINGYCSTPPDDGSCNLDDFLNDGCASNAVCIEELESEAGACYTMPACAGDGTCPVGLSGAVCNDDYLVTKDKVCLLGLCESEANCPSDWPCVRWNESDVLGVCSSGALGSPCTAPEHCQSGMCTQLPGFGGICL